jgi:PKD repeat protein
VTAVDNALVVHVYMKSGEYNVSLSVTDNLGATNSTVKTLFVRARVSASFSYAPNEPHVHELVAFDASNSTATEGTIVSYVWDFGDGNRSTLQTAFAKHSYPDVGVFDVTLNVTSSSGDWDVESQVVNVTAQTMVPPKAVFTWVPAVPEVGQSVEFNASESTADGGMITSYVWTFSDGTTHTLTQPMVTHVFQDFGTYTVTLNVTNSEGLSDAVNHSVTVMAKPIADFFFIPEQPRVCGVVTFNASISSPRGSHIVSFEWDFGDASPNESGIVITHRFGRIGEYVVSLKVTNSENLWDLKNVTVKVLPHIADLNEDGKVDILDLAIFARAYGSVPGSERWNPRADIDGNGVVNILDGVVVARSYNMCLDPIDP